MNPNPKMSTIIGYSPEITAMLEALKRRIDIMLDQPPSGIQNLHEDPSKTDPRFDIIIGNVGLKDLSKAKVEPKALPGLDQWPNVQSLPPRSPSTPSESPERVETAGDAFDAWWDDLAGTEYLRVTFSSAFRAGYEAGRNAT